MPHTGTVPMRRIRINFNATTDRGDIMFTAVGLPTQRRAQTHGDWPCTLKPRCLTQGEPRTESTSFSSARRLSAVPIAVMRLFYRNEIILPCGCAEPATLDDQRPFRQTIMHDPDSGAHGLG